MVDYPCEIISMAPNPKGEDAFTFLFAVFERTNLKSYEQEMRMNGFVLTRRYRLQIQLSLLRNEQVMLDVVSHTSLFTVPMFSNKTWSSRDLCQLLIQQGRLYSNNSNNHVSLERAQSFFTTVNHDYVYSGKCRFKKDSDNPPCLQEANIEATRNAYQQQCQPCQQQQVESEDECEKLKPTFEPLTMSGEKVDGISAGTKRNLDQEVGSLDNSSSNSNNGPLVANMKKLKRCLKKNPSRSRSNPNAIFKPTRNPEACFKITYQGFSSITAFSDSLNASFATLEKEKVEKPMVIDNLKPAQVTNLALEPCPAHISTETLFACMPDSEQETVLRKTLDHYRFAQTLRYPIPDIMKRAKQLIY
jgi:hypothetical protein